MTEGWTGFQPILRVRDVEISLRFYCDVLGFNEDWVFRGEAEFPAYARVSRGPVIARLSEHGFDDIEQASLFVHVPDVDAVYQEFKSKGLKCEPPETAPELGLRGFEFFDPDGHRLEFATGLGVTESEE